MKPKLQPPDKGILAENLAQLARRLALGAFLCLVFMLCAHYFPRKVTYEYKIPDKNYDVASSQPDKVPSSLRILREENGKLGIFRPDGTLERTVNIDIASLPRYDRELLEEGIAADESEIPELVDGLMS